MIDKLKININDKDLLEILRGGGVSFFLRILGIVIGLILTWLIAELFESEGLGIYVLSLTLLRMFSLFAKIGLDISSVRFISSFISQNKFSSIVLFRRKILIIAAISSIFSSLLMYFFAIDISNLMQIDSKYIQLNAFFILPTSFFMINYQSLRGLKRIAEFSFFYRVAQSLFTIIFILIIYDFNQSQEIPIYAYLLSILLVSFFSFLSLRYSLNIITKGQESADLELMSYVSLFKVSIPLMLAQSVQFIMAWTDKLMLGAIDTPNVINGLATNAEEVGVYHIAFRLSMFAAIALMSINSIISPKISEMFSRNDMIGLEKIVHQSTKIIFWTSLPLVIIFFTFPSFFLGIFGDGEEFQSGIVAFLLLSLARLISALSGPVGNILQMTGHQNSYAKILFLGALINILLNLILIPDYGINGAAIASTSSLIFWNISMVLLVKNKFGFYTFYIPFIKR